MTYINHIWEGEGWSNLSEIGKVLPDYSFRQNSKRYLPEPERLNWRTSFILPNNAGRDVGDLEDSWDRYNYIPLQNQGVRALVSCDIDDEQSGFERKCQIKKFLKSP